MRHSNGPYNDLTIYDKGLDDETKNWMRKISYIYTPIVTIHSLITLFEFIATSGGFQMYINTFALYNLIAMIYSVAYVYYPQTEFTRSRITFYILAIFVVINLIFFILVQLYFVVIFIGINFDSGYQEERMILNILFVLGYILVSIPVAHCYLLYLIRKKRWAAAKKMNVESVQLGEIQHFESVPSADMEVENMPLNNPIDQQQISTNEQAINPHTVVYSQPNSTTLNPGVDYV